MSVYFDPAAVVSQRLDIMDTFSHAAGKPAQGGSTLSKVLGKNHQPQNKVSGVSSLKQGAVNPTGDKTASGLKAQVQENLGNMKAGWDQARQDALTVAEGVGPTIEGQGITAAGVRASHGAASESSLVTAAVHVATGAVAQGAGTLAKMGMDGSSLALDAVPGSQKLSSTQQGKLYAQLADRPKMSASQAEMARMSGAKAPMTEVTSDLDIKGVAELLGDQFDQQKEVVEARAAVAALGEVEKHDDAVENRSDLVDPARELAAAVESGNTVQEQAIIENDFGPVAAVALDYMELKPTAMHLTMEGEGATALLATHLDAVDKDALNAASDAFDLEGQAQKLAAQANAMSAPAQISA